MTVELIISQDHSTLDDLGSLALLVLALESIINLSYYKDVIFSFVIAGFYLGVFYKQEYPNVKTWGEVWFSLSLIFIFITLLHNFRSAFYIKHNFYISQMKELKSRDFTEQNFQVDIGNEVKFWLRESQSINNLSKESLSESSMSFHKNISLRFNLSKRETIDLHIDDTDAS